MRKAMLAVIAGLLIGVASQALAADEPENVLKYRKNLMKGLSGHAGAITGVVKGEVGYVGDVAAHARSISAIAPMIPKAFPEGTGEGSGLETRALPDIWQDFPKFEAAADKLEAESAKLAEIASNGGDVAAIGAQLQNMGKACGGCHKPFRAEKD